jgi:hypothetical protein
VLPGRLARCFFAGAGHCAPWQDAGLPDAGHCAPWQDAGLPDAGHCAPCQDAGLAGTGHCATWRDGHCASWQDAVLADAGRCALEKIKVWLVMAIVLPGSWCRPLCYLARWRLGSCWPKCTWQNRGLADAGNCNS